MWLLEKIKHFGQEIKDKKVWLFHFARSQGEAPNSSEETEIAEKVSRLGED